jgi:ABC-type branched-subunit amino acid transport system substrate-binding protein
MSEMTLGAARLARRPQRMRALATLVLLALVSAGCGIRRSHQDVVAAAYGRAGLATATANPGGGAAEVAGGDQSAAGQAVQAQSGIAAANAPVAATAGSGSGASAAAPGSQGGTGGTSGAGQTKSTIRIGVVGTLSGVAGASLGPQADGVRVWARWINDRGGVNGHPVEVLVGDDGGDPARHQALVQEFVEQDKVIAFVANPEALTGQSSVAYLTKAGVPEIGSEGAGQWFYQSPVYFPQGSTGNALGQASLLGYSAVAKKLGFTKVATITCVEVQVCRDSYAKAKAGFGKYGITVVYQSQNSLGQPDFTAECLNARSAGAEFLSVAMDANSVKNVARSCARQGYHPMLAISSGQTTVDLKDDPDLDGTVIASLTGPWINTGSAEVKEFVDAMNHYAPGSAVAGGDMLGWASAKVFELGTKQLPEPPTSKAIVDALQSIHGDPLPDIDGELLFNRGAPATPSVCVFTVIIRNKSWTSDGTRPCTGYDPNL